MEWEPGQMSNDVEDRRDDPGGGGFNFGGGGIGIVGVLVLLVISLITGRNYLGAFLGGSSTPTTQHQTAPTSSSEDRDAHLISFVLDDVQKTWTGTFQKQGRTYR